MTEQQINELKLFLTTHKIPSINCKLLPKREKEHCFLHNLDLNIS